MGKIYDALTISKWIINKIHPEPLKLQKLLYLAQGYSFAFYDRELFDDDMEGWVHGPVVKSVYEKYKDYKYKPINITYDDVVLDQDAIDVLNYVINNYAKYDSNSLREITHKQEPWIFSREGLDSNERSNKIISKQDIADYFTNEVFAPDDKEWD